MTNLIITTTDICDPLAIGPTLFHFTTNICWLNIRCRSKHLIGEHLSFVFWGRGKYHFQTYIYIVLDLRTLMLSPQIDFFYLCLKYLRLEVFLVSCYFRCRLRQSHWPIWTTFFAVFIRWWRTWLDSQNMQEGLGWKRRIQTRSYQVEPLIVTGIRTASALVQDGQRSFLIPSVWTKFKLIMFRTWDWRTPPWKCLPN